jgi:hypothetical protein
MDLEKWSGEVALGSQFPTSQLSHRLFVFGLQVSIPDKDRVADRHPGTEFAYESVT